MSRPVITLLTDFGQADGYVGTMKGVMLRICPQATLVDISHDVAPQDLQQAAYVLSAAVPFFPAGTVHTIVVDPEVGTVRRPIIVQTGRATYVAPDNGVLTLALAQDPAQLAVHLSEPGYQLSPVSATFHGRDIFAPAAAHLAAGIPPREMGEPLPVLDLISLPLSQPAQQSDGSWLGEILHIDRFGNLITNIRCSLDGSQWALAQQEIPVPTEELSVAIAGTTIQGLRQTFAEVEQQEILAYIGSSGRLEIAVRGGDAAAQLGVGVGDPVLVTGLAPPAHFSPGAEYTPGTPWTLTSARKAGPRGG